MNTCVGRTARYDAKCWIQQVDRLGQRIASRQVPQVCDLAGGQAASDIKAEKSGDRPPDKPVGIARGLKHREGGAVDNQHRPVREDGPRNLDGFDVAIREVNRLHIPEPHDTDETGCRRLASQSLVDINIYARVARVHLPGLSATQLKIRTARDRLTSAPRATWCGNRRPSKRLP